MLSWVTLNSLTSCLIGRIDTLKKDVEDLRLQGDELKSNLDRMDNEMVQ